MRQQPRHRPRVLRSAVACATECDSNRLSCSLRRVSHRDGSGVRSLREDSQRFRRDLHAFVIVLFQLFGRSRSILAILWSLARSFCARPLLSLLHHRSKRRTFIAKVSSAALATGAAGGYPANRPLRNRALSTRTRSALGSLVL